jgi:hypothetical protein
MTAMHLQGTKPDGTVAAARLDATGALVVADGAVDPGPVLVTEASGASVAAWAVGGGGLFVRFRLRAARTVAGLWVYLGAPSGNAKAGLYASDGTTLTQRALSAAVPLTATNDGQLLAFAATDVPAAADWWAFLALDNTTATLLRYTLGAGSIGLKLGTGANAAAYPSPPATQAIAALTGASSGYTPVLALP